MSERVKLVSIKHTQSKMTTIHINKKAFLTNPWHGDSGLDCRRPVSTGASDVVPFKKKTTFCPFAFVLLLAASPLCSTARAPHQDY